MLRRHTRYPLRHAATQGFESATSLDIKSDTQVQRIRSEQVVRVEERNSCNDSALALSYVWFFSR